MWIVRVALRRPYTFVVLGLLILGIGPLAISRTPVDIFPNINIPVVTVLWTYGGFAAKDMADRIVLIDEKLLPTVVNDVEHIESQSLRGIGVVKVFLQPGANLELAVSQITAASQGVLRNLPPGILPPFILVYNASSVPILQLALAGRNEREVFDLAANFLRPQLSTVFGASIPAPYGGKQPQIQVDLDLEALTARGLAPADVVSAIATQNIILPAGTSKIGSFEYDVDLNGSPKRMAELNDLPIKAVGNTPIYVRDVAHVRDGSPPQTNVVRVNGQRASLLTIQKTGNASTLDVIARIKETVARTAPTLPGELRITPLFDQSLFVRASIEGVLREAVIAGCLTALMILIFLGSWRSTLIIAISIPLSILSSIIALSALGETINIMTLGGLALAVGVLVDDATVAIENINSHLEAGKDLEPAILDGAQQIAIPAFVSTICICIVFVPMFFLSGVARYLFVPMAEAVVFAMLASYVLSRTLVPTMAKYLLKPHASAEAARFRCARGRSQSQPVCQAPTPPRHGVSAPACWISNSARARRRTASGLRRLVPGHLRGVHGSCLVGRRGLLPIGRRRAVQASSASADRYAHRGNGRAVRSRRAGHPACDPAQRNRERGRQHRPALQRDQPVVFELGAGRVLGRRYPLLAVGRPSPVGRIRPRFENRARREISWRAVFLSSGGHRDADPQFRSAGTN
jgi:multidrug efflux pump subunit AcrB